MKTKPPPFLLSFTFFFSVFLGFIYFYLPMLFLFYSSESLPHRFEENLNKGLKYYEGLGVQQDHKEAMKWFKLALVEEEYSRELPEYAFMHGNGLESERQRQYQRLGQDGLVQISENALGEIYEQGKVVQQNYEEAVKWYGRALSKAFTQNFRMQDCWDVMTHPKAHYNLGRMYDEGLGLPEDNHKAFLLLHFANDAWSQQARNRNSGFGRIASNYGSGQYFYYLNIADHSMEDAKHRIDLIAKELESYPEEMNAYTGLHLEDSRYFQRMLAEDKKKKT